MVISNSSNPRNLSCDSVLPHSVFRCYLPRPLRIAPESLDSLASKPFSNPSCASRPRIDDRRLPPEKSGLRRWRRLLRRLRRSDESPPSVRNRIGPISPSECFGGDWKDLWRDKKTFIWRLMTFTIICRKWHWKRSLWYFFGRITLNI